MKLYHVTYKKNLENIKKSGLSIDYHLLNSNYLDQTSGKAIYLSKFIKSNNLPIHMNGKELISLEINLESLNHNLIHPDDGIYWAYNNEIMFHEDDLDEIKNAFKLKNDIEASNKLDYLESLSDSELIKEFKDLWFWYLENEGEIAYLANINFDQIVNIHDL